MVKNIIQWILESNRWKHLTGGILVGAGADDIYCAAYAGIGVAGALELKDYQWGGKPDWIDFTLTIVGVSIGYASRVFVLSTI